MRLFLLATLAAACVAFSRADAAPRAGNHTVTSAATRYLYVAVGAGKYGNHDEVLRFPFVNGFPAKQPDLIYQDVTYPIAVGHDGTLYANTPLGCCQGLGTIDVFPPNSNVSSRQITLPYLNEDTTIVTAIVEGPSAYLGVGYDAFPSGARYARDPHRKGSPLHGVAVYPPGASGGGPPLLLFDVARDLTGPNSLGIDAKGNLYIATESADDLHNRVYTVANWITRPEVRSHLDMPSSYNALGLDFSDGGSRLYILELGPKPDNIAVYAYGARNHAKARRTLNVLTSRSLGPVPSLGIEGNVAYVGEYSLPPLVVGYDKHASGSPPPIFTLNMPSNVELVLDLVTGP